MLHVTVFVFVSFNKKLISVYWNFNFCSVDELFEKVLERLEEDGKEFDYDENLVEQVFVIKLLYIQ